MRDIDNCKVYTSSSNQNCPGYVRVQLFSRSPAPPKRRSRDGLPLLLSADSWPAAFPAGVRECRDCENTAEATEFHAETSSSRTTRATAWTLLMARSFAVALARWVSAVRLVPSASP